MRTLILRQINRSRLKSVKALQGAWGAWAPEEEKCQLIMTGFVGAILGATGVTSIGGVIVSKYGWPAIFYVSAAMTLLWVLTWPGKIHLIRKVHISNS